MDPIKKEIDRIAAFYTKHPHEEGLKAAINKIVQDTSKEAVVEVILPSNVQLITKSKK